MLQGGIGIVDTARRVGHYRWCELQLFEALGRWSVDIPEPAVQLRLGPHCALHAWHAELWHDRLPELGPTTAEELTRPANDALARVAMALVAPDSPELTIERLVGVYRVLVPRLVATYTHHLDVIRSRTDWPTTRILTLILRDEVEEWQEGELLIQSLLVSPEQVRRASNRQRDLELLLVEAGGVTGPDPVEARPPVS